MIVLFLALAVVLSVLGLDLPFTEWCAIAFILTILALIRYYSSIKTSYLIRNVSSICIHLYKFILFQILYFPILLFLPISYHKRILVLLGYSSIYLVAHLVLEVAIRRVDRDQNDEEGF